MTSLAMTRNVLNVSTRILLSLMSDPEMCLRQIKAKERTNVV
ncbi:hypothetical protein SAMN06264849_104172 [Melghirimyces algeriensis]|uniref:Uncharacterized protein n=1 Tax=Melghirimyces algeriensis TaxID=910412 RepID=A0A521CTN1_9BACL|nr:hypothetical protein SAMN06264849_104172 [Melghirimyces algeriensis]